MDLDAFLAMITCPVCGNVGCTPNDADCPGPPDEDLITPNGGPAGAPTGDPSTWPTPPGGTWRPVDPAAGDGPWALDTSVGTGYVGYDSQAGRWFTDPTGDPAAMTEHTTGDDAIRTLAETLGPFPDEPASR